MVDMSPSWLLLGLRTTEYIHSRLTKKPSEMNALLTDLMDRLRSVNRDVNEGCFEDLRAAVKLLTNGLHLTIEAASAPDKKTRANNLRLRDQQLLLAYDRFISLTSLKPGGTITGKSVTIDNAFLRTAGYWGTFHYFVLNQKPKMALAEVLTCGVEHPILALNVFGPQFFGDQLSTKYDKHRRAVDELKFKTVAECDVEERKLISEYDNDGWRMAGNAAKYVGGAAAGFVSFAAVSAVATVIPFVAPAAPIAGAASVRAVVQDIGQKRARTISSIINQFDGFRDKIAKAAEAEKMIATEVVAQSTQRLEELKKIEPMGLRRMWSLLAT